MNSTKNQNEDDNNSGNKKKKSWGCFSCFKKKSKKAKLDQNQKVSDAELVQSNKFETIETHVAVNQTPNEASPVITVGEPSKVTDVILRKETPNNTVISTENNLEKQNKRHSEKTRLKKLEYLEVDPNTLTPYNDEKSRPLSHNISVLTSKMSPGLDSPDARYSEKNMDNLQLVQESQSNFRDIKDDQAKDLLEETPTDKYTTFDDPSEDIVNDEVSVSTPRSPIGFKNPIGYCYLNSVIQVLGSCLNFRNEFLSKVESENFKDDNDSLFVKGLFELLNALKMDDKNNIDRALGIVQNYITESRTGDDVYKCFMNILTRVSSVMQPENTFSSMGGSIKSEDNYRKFQNREPKFVFDNFYGQFAFQIICKTCGYVCSETFQIMKSLALPVPTSNHSISLKKCIDIFLSGSDLEMDENQRCHCDGGSKNLLLFTKITHCPKYLFIYLNRGSFFVDGVKNNTFVTCGNDISIDTTTETNIPYKLISTIDHIGDNHGGHYYCKCSYETDTWWLLNDKMVMKLTSEDEIVSENTIVFLFKRDVQ